MHDIIWYVLQHIYKRQAEFSSLINKVFNAIGSDSIVGIYGAAFSDVTIVLTRDVTIVLTPMHGDVNNASLGKQWVRSKTGQVTWVLVTCEVT